MIVAEIEGGKLTCNAALGAMSVCANELECRGVPEHSKLSMAQCNAVLNSSSACHKATGIQMMYLHVQRKQGLCLQRVGGCQSQEMYSFCIGKYRQV